jgi:hypothetical protein
MLDQNDKIISDEVNLDTGCRFIQAVEQRAKCRSLNGLGRALHGTQDFYSHSNWSDEADPTRPITVDNPPGLNRPGPSPLLELRSTTAPSVPADLATGCFVLPDHVPGAGECAGRVTHAALNKDTGLIDPGTGATTGPTTPRGMVKNNFAKAVAGAIDESRRQWRDLRDELVTRYGEQRAAVMVCALTRDDPIRSCQGRAAPADQPLTTGSTSDGKPQLYIGLAVIAVLLALSMLRLRPRRRR